MRTNQAIPLLYGELRGAKQLFGDETSRTQFGLVARIVRYPPPLFTRRILHVELHGHGRWEAKLDNRPRPAAAQSLDSTAFAVPGIVEERYRPSFARENGLVGIAAQGLADEPSVPAELRAIGG
jgi:hypothetical protein